MLRPLRTAPMIPTATLNHPKSTGIQLVLPSLEDHHDGAEFGPGHSTSPSHCLLEQSKYIGLQ
jgi:hypothetical protein